MQWIQKNLTLVLGGLVGLVLLGGSAFFLWSESAREKEIDAQLEEKRGEWTRLNGLNPFPDDKNIRIIRDESARVEVLANSLRDRIQPVPVPPVSDTFSLKVLIETTLSDLRQEAEASGVNLPDRFAFTFQRLREMPQFESNAIPRLAEQLAHISLISRVLFDAKVHSLDTLRRSPVLRDEGTGGDYLTKRPATNNWVIRFPYDLSFRSFSTELAAVLESLAALDHTFAIKTINIEPTSLPSAGGPRGPVFFPSPGGAPPSSGPTPGGMDPSLMQRYGLGPGGGRGEDASGGGGMDANMRARYGLGGPGGGADAMRSRYGLGGPGAGGVNAPTLSQPMIQQGMPTMPMPGAPPPPAVVLEKRPLRVILQLDLIKPRTDAPAAGRRSAPMRAAPVEGEEASESTEEVTEEVSE